MMQELKDSGLNGSHINGCQPTSSTPASVPPAGNPVSHSDIEAPLANVDKCLEASSKFTLLQISGYKIQLQVSLIFFY